ncbi:MAG TPA: hypothetical protein VHA11_09025 [Bryobacteraceae bacterium]|nr:hypothetical protein [Bryobacteraceae bacterium]
MTAAPHSRKWTILGAVIVLAGIALRVRLFVSEISLRLDECSLALNILSRSLADLMKPLDYAQGAPLLFLWVQRLVLAASHSTSELALRLVPVLSGSAACAGFWLLCRRLRLSTAGTLCATGVFCFSPLLIDYSNQAKQYSTDLFMAIAIYLAALRFFEDASRRNTLVYAAVGVLAVGISYPSVFVLAGVGTVGLIDAWRRQDRRGLALQFAVASVWAAGFVLNFAFFLRHLTHIPGMLGYWQRNYWAFMPLSSLTPAWLLQAAIKVGSMTGYKASYVLPLVLIGGAMLLRRDWRTAAMLWIPAMLAVLASAGERYPFAERMILFLVPAVLVTAGASLEARLPLLRWKLQPVLMVLFCWMLFVSVRRAAAPLVDTEQFAREDFRSAFLAAAGDARCQDRILVYERAANHYRYYSRFRWNRRYPAAIVTAAQLAGDAFARKHDFWIHFAAVSDGDVAAFRDPPCFWLVFAHTSDREIAALVKPLVARGYREVGALRRTGAGARLFALP